MHDVTAQSDEAIEATRGPWTGRRSRKKAQTRQRLRETAIRLALEQGYERLTIEALTEAADVSLRTFFNHFTSKDDALLGLDPDGAEALAAALAARPADEPPPAALRVVLCDLAESFAEREPLWQSRMELLRANPQLWPQMIAAFSDFERTLAQAIAARTGRDPATDLYPAVPAAAVIGATRVALAHWRAAGNPASLRDLLDAAFDTLAGGLAAPASPGSPSGTEAAKAAGAAVLPGRHTDRGARA